MGLALTSVGPLAGQTLREAIGASGVAHPPMAADLDRSITSYAVLDDSAAFIIAYYWKDTAGPILADSLRIRFFNRSESTWRSRSLPRTAPPGPGGETDLQLGSAVRITRSEQHFLLDTHLTPSAGTLLVLSKDIEPVAALPGWLRAAGSDGLVVFQHSMVHFAPTHGAEIWGYDGRTDRTDLIYPRAPYPSVRARYIEEVRQLYERVGAAWFRNNDHHMDPARFDSNILDPVLVERSGEAVAFVVRFGGGAGTPAATPLMDVVVHCRQLHASPTCAETPLEDVRSSYPGLSIPELLEGALHGR